jgi:hypothetical protein
LGWPRGRWRSPIFVIGSSQQPTTRVSGGILASEALFDAAALHRDGVLGLAILAIGRPHEPVTTIRSSLAGHTSR